MRSYPRNSPEAAARVLALLLVADGNVCPSELRLLESLDTAGALGLDRDGLPRIVQGLCEDLMVAAPSCDLFSTLDSDTRAALFGEVDAPYLQRRILALATAAAGADRHRAENETRLLEELRDHWRMGSSVQGPGH